MALEEPPDSGPWGWESPISLNVGGALHPQLWSRCLSPCDAKRKGYELLVQHHPKGEAPPHKEAIETFLQWLKNNGIFAMVKTV